MKRILIICLILSLLILNGCSFKTQDEIVEKCYNDYTIQDCTAQKCTFEQTVGYTGHIEYENNYLKCKIEKLIKGNLK